MRRQLGTLAMVVTLVLVATDLVWACRLWENQCGCYSARRCVVQCCPVEEVCCVPEECEPVMYDPADAGAAAQEAVPAKPVPVAPPAAAAKPAPVAPPAAAVTPAPAAPPAAPPAAKPVEKPVVPPAAPAVAPPAAVPPAAPPVAKPVEKPVAPPAEKPAPKAADKPAEKPAPKAADKPAEKPAEKPAGKPEKKKADEDNPFGQTNPRGLRLWTDASGKYQVEARFVGVVGDTIRLQKADGRYVRILLDKLCDADQRLVLQIGALAAN
jgi:hypothetical protein